MKKGLNEPEERFEAPVWFHLPRSFYVKLAKYAAEFGISQDKFLKKAIDVCAEDMRHQDAPLSRALGDSEVSARFREMAGSGPKKWWANLSPEERKARAKKAIDARWEKAKAKAKATTASE